MLILFIAGLKVLSDQPPDTTAATLTIQWIQPSWVDATEKFKQYDILVKRLGDNPVEETQQSLVQSMFFYPDLIQILSRIYPNFIQIL